MQIGTSAGAGAAQQSGSVAMLKLAQDQQKVEGQAAVEMLESNKNVAKGAPEPGKGGSVDLQA